MPFLSKGNASLATHFVGWLFYPYAVRIMRKLLVIGKFYFYEKIIYTYQMLFFLLILVLG